MRGFQGSRGGICLALVGLLGLAGLAAGGDVTNDAGPGRADEGRRLFLKEWVAGAPSRHGGDGLGPAYNESSCVACHNQGGAGGAGPASKNVDFVTAAVTPDEDKLDKLGKQIRDSQREFRAGVAKRRGEPPPQSRAKGTPPDRAALARLHPGFRDSSTVVVHRFSSRPAYEPWRLAMLDPTFSPSRLRSGLFGESESLDIRMNVNFGKMRNPFPDERGDFTLVTSQVNPPALFGDGLIDSIPGAVIAAEARRQAMSPPWRVKGRVARQLDGRIGRFGWKAQAATLDEFVLTACAVELGLEVPGRHQGVDPRHPAGGPAGLDLSRAECDSLTAFVRGLAPPAALRPETPEEAKRIDAGRLAFEQVGCAACHAPKLGDVDGIYSDLLLHDMGDDTADGASYGSRNLFDDGATRGIQVAGFPSGVEAFKDGAELKPASQREWRTPPLWGLRDSGPYLHDGRAETIDQAIAFHGGQAEGARQFYFRMPPDRRAELQAFLKTLVAPSTALIASTTR
jgi:CxxC motif-containing protein (DUF1111 family)